MYVTDRHDMIFVVKVALNPNTIQYNSLARVIHEPCSVEKNPSAPAKMLNQVVVVVDDDDDDDDDFGDDDDFLHSVFIYTMKIFNHVYLEKHFVQRP